MILKGHQPSATMHVHMNPALSFMYYVVGVDILDNNHCCTPTFLSQLVLPQECTPVYYIE